MRAICTCAAGLTILLALGCGGPPKPKDLIVGKWEATEPELAKRMKKTYEFSPDGSLKVSIAKGPIDTSMNTTAGKYTFTADDLVEIELNHPADKKGSWKEALKAKVEVTKDTLILTEQDEGQEVTKFKKKS